MKSKSWALGLVIALVGALLLGLLSYVALGPYRTMRAFGDSLAARDSTAIADCVDFPKLRQSLKTQLADRVLQQSKSVFADNPIAALAAGMANSMSDTLIESLVTPAGLEKLLAGEQLFSVLGDSSNNHSVEVPKAIANASYSFQSLSAFTVTLEPKPGVKVTLILEREGFSWKITGARLNESAS